MTSGDNSGKRSAWGPAIEIYIVGALGAALFKLLSLPLPYLLGAMSAVMVWRLAAGRHLDYPRPLRNTAFAVLGIYFGLGFTASTLAVVFPYLIPYLLITLLLIGISLVYGWLLSKWMKIDIMSSVFGCIPGGLSEMVAVGESLKANVAMIALLQTVRLLTVVFLVPFTVIHLFMPTGEAIEVIHGGAAEANLWLYALYIPFGLFGWLIRNRIPAPYVIGPMLLTALTNISLGSLPPMPVALIVAAQVTLGVYMGKSFSWDDLKRGGKWGGVIAAMTILLIVCAFAMGGLIALLTPMSLPTAILSVAPGGLVEMTLTAVAVGADASVVSSLQLVRVLFIILVVPAALKWFFITRNKQHTRSQS